MKTLDLYITRVCNLNCEYCYVDIVKESQVDFPLENFLERINLLDYDEIKFYGGEPLLEWDKIQNIVKMIRDKKSGQSFTIITNGLLINKEKLDFLDRNGVEIVISLHSGSKKRVKSLIPLLKNYNDIVGFYIILNPNNFSEALVDFLFFSKWGLKNFSFAPEIYNSWDEISLKNFKKILDSLIPYIQKHNIKISGISHNSLKIPLKGCEKTVFDFYGKYSPCNRFSHLEKRKTPFSYKHIYNFFDENLSLSNDKNRWFYICPIGWYIDHENQSSLFKTYQSYIKLNHIFLDFFRRLSENKLTFLNQNIQEIRLTLTQQCNIRCQYCYVDFKNHTLDLLVGKNIIDFFLEQDGNVKYISFFGGEPFLEFENLKHLTLYALEKAKKLKKEIFFIIATNFTLINQEKIDFLKEYNYEIHISFNGTIEHNNIMRDGSSHKVLENIYKYILPNELQNRVVILFAFTPNDIGKLQENIKFILKIGFERILFELIFGEKYMWTKELILKSVIFINQLSKHYPHMIIYNKNKERNYLDIDVKGRCHENSLEYNGIKIIPSYVKYFNILLKKNLFN